MSGPELGEGPRQLRGPGEAIEKLGHFVLQRTVLPFGVTFWLTSPSSNSRAGFSSGSFRNSSSLICFSATSMAVLLRLAWHDNTRPLAPEEHVGLTSDQSREASLLDQLSIEAVVGGRLGFQREVAPGPVSGCLSHELPPGGVGG